MSRTKSLQKATICAIVGAALFAANPNCDPRDVVDPYSVAQKASSDVGFRNSGIFYALGYTAVAASIIGGIASLYKRNHENNRNH